MTLAKLPSPYLHVIQRGIESLKDQNVVPQWIKLSPSAHQTLLEEIEKRDGRKHTKIFEILNLQVEIEPECPAGGGYMGGEEEKNEMLR